MVPELERALSSPVDAKLLRLLKRPGAAVRSGEPVAELDLTESRLAIEKLAGHPTLRIEDSGSGFGPEAQANLFTPFFSTKPDGQGIGLTLVREVLSAHGFDYSLHQQPGEPTTFTIVF